MLKTAIATFITAMSIGGLADAQDAIPDGTQCNVDLRVIDLHYQIVLGAPGTAHETPQDVHFAVVSVDDVENPLCQRAMRADRATMNAASEQIEGADFVIGDELKAKVIYRKFMSGKMLYDEYHHTAIIIEGVGTGSSYQGFGLLP
jgi:hypothetical protein|tara:strand:- start:8 stop:445 length:438 start_codon:yes stop_codon:yes gene_type:complete